jgi:hypothetical protein
MQAAKHPLFILGFILNLYLLLYAMFTQLCLCAYTCPRGHWPARHASRHLQWQRVRAATVGTRVWLLVVATRTKWCSTGRMNSIQLVE